MAQCTIPGTLPSRTARFLTGQFNKLTALSSLVAFHFDCFYFHGSQGAASDKPKDNIGKNETATRHGFGTAQAR